MASPPALGVFRKDGEYWTVGWKDRPLRLKDAKGLAYLALLLRHPTTEFHALDLVGGLTGYRDDDDAGSSERTFDADGLHVAASDDAGEMLDDRAKATYRRRLEELRAELATAMAAGHVEAGEAAEREIASLTAELGRAVGLHGRSRRAASAAERARQSVTKTARAAVERIKQGDALLGDWLARCIRTGTFCSYEPDPVAPIAWEFGPRDAESPVESATSDTPAAPTDRTPFVGRVHERDTFGLAIDRARRGNGSLVLLAGGPGVGKSRLVREMADCAADRGFRVLVGHCYERDEPFPFLPFAEILESGLAQTASLDDHRRWMGEAAAELAQIAPRLRHVFPDLPAPRELPPQQRRRYLFQSFSDALGRAAQAGPRLLVLEDLHWADESTLALLVHLAHELSQVPAVVIGTFRPNDDEQNPALARTLEELMRAGVRPLRLAGLSRDETCGMLEALGARLPSNRLANLIFDVTDGNPFFVREIFQHLVEDGRVFDAAGEFRSDLTIDEIDVPENVRLVIGRRLARLSVSERKILAAAAVIGRSFSFQLVRLLLEQVDVDELCDAVEKAQRMGLLVASAEGPESPFTFAHEILRQTLLHGMTLPRRQNLHAGVAHAIERLHPRAAEERAGDVAYHLLRAGGFATRHDVATALFIAAKAALGASAFEQAHRWFESALEHQDDPAVRAEILSVMATADYGLGHVDDSLVQGSGETGGRLIGRSFVDVVDGLRSRLAIAAGRLTPFVGRVAESTTLAECWARVTAGQGQHVLLVGEAGVGKSRLAYQLRERLVTTSHRWLECGASPYTEGTPFHPVIALVTQGLGIVATDSAAERFRKIERGLSDLASAEHVALVADFLGLPLPTSLALTPDVQRRRTMELLAQWTIALSAAQPLVLLVEDLHWCDASSLELLGRIIAQGATARVFIVATARPEFTTPWSTRANATTLQIERLTKHEARAMVTTLLGETVHAETLDTLVARADGVPLYVEELTKAVAAPGAGHGADAVPTTLAGSLMARLDRLSTAKEVAQRAAVLGREFDHPLLAAVAGMDEARLRQGLTRLVDAEIVVQRGEPPRATYTFKHALVQQAAYDSLPRRTRQQIHGQVVDVLRAQSPELEVVARHAEAAGRRDDAITFYGRAGEQAQARSAHAEAIAHLGKAIALVDASIAPDRELTLQLALGASLMAARGYAHPDTALAYERAVELGTAAVDAARFGTARAGLATCYYTRGEVERGRAVAAELLAAGDARSDREQMLMGHVNVAGPEYYQGKFASSLVHCERALALYEPSRHYGLVRMLGADQGVAALGYAAWDLWYLGRPDTALARARDAIALARRLNDPFCLALALFVETAVRWVRRDVDALREIAGQVVALAESQGFPLWLGLGRVFRASTGVVAGDAAALADLMEGMTLAAEMGHQAAAPSTLAILAEAQRAAGRLAEAQGTVAMAMAVAAQTGQPYYDADLYRLDGDLLLAAGGEPDDAAARYHRALAIAREQGTRALELRAATSLARLLRDRGEHTEARALLAPVYATFTEGFDTPDLIDAKTLLGETAAPLG